MNTNRLLAFFMGLVLAIFSGVWLQNQLSLEPRFQSVFFIVIASILLLISLYVIGRTIFKQDWPES